MKKTVIKMVLVGLALFTCVSPLAAKSKKAEIDKIKKAGVLKVGCKEDVPGYGYLNPETGKHEGLERLSQKRFLERKV